MALDEYKPQKGGDDFEEGRQFKYVGTTPDRPDGFDKVTGRARFGADMSAPGMLHAAIVRSPHAHARIVKIDTSKAEALDGVKAVVTRADFATGLTGDTWNVLENIMAGDTALYDGHAVAAVAATSALIARDAAYRDGPAEMPPVHLPEIGGAVAHLGQDCRRDVENSQ